MVCRPAPVCLPARRACPPRLPAVGRPPPACLSSGPVRFSTLPSCPPPARLPVRRACPPRLPVVRPVRFSTPAVHRLPVHPTVRLRPCRPSTPLPPPPSSRRLFGRFPSSVGRQTDAAERFFATKSYLCTGPCRRAGCTLRTGAAPEAPLQYRRPCKRDSCSPLPPSAPPPW